MYEHDENRSPKRGCAKGCFVSLLIAIGAIGICFFLLILIVLFIIGIFSDDNSSFSKKFSSLSSVNDGLVEKFVDGQRFSQNKIVLIDIRGIISEGDGASFWNGANSSLIVRQLSRAENDPSVKAVLLYLDTPGGEVTAADNIYQGVLKLKNSGKKVVSYMNSVAASGGYYIAVGSDYIVAHRLCVTGSIGVIMQTYNYHELLNKIGVFTETYKSGTMKDMLDGSRPRTEEEKIIAQDIVNKIYDEFVRIVAEGRKLEEEEIKSTEIGDGRIFIGFDALELRMIDETGLYEDALNKTISIARIPSDDYKLVTYEKTLSFKEIFANIKSSETKIEVDFKNFNLESFIKPGKPYFLPTK